MDQNLKFAFSDISVSIVITTKNRIDELISCIESCLKLNSVNEILVFDDGSTDNTFEFVKNKYPELSLFRSEDSLGLINARTKCALLAKGDIIVSVDDDCVFVDPNTITEIIKYFNHDRIAAVTIPVIDILQSNKISQEGIGNEKDIYISSEFRGCAHAIKKEIFLKLGGYNKNLVRQEEEKELCTRLYSAGYIVRVGNCKNPIMHHHSTIRNNSQIAYYRARNKIIVNYVYTPKGILYLELIKQVIGLLLFESKNGYIKPCIKGLKDAVLTIYESDIGRQPLKITKYLYLKKLRLKSPLKIYL